MLYSKSSIIFDVHIFGVEYIRLWVGDVGWCGLGGGVQGGSSWWHPWLPIRAAAAIQKVAYSRFRSHRQSFCVQGIHILALSGSLLFLCTEVCLPVENTSFQKQGNSLNSLVLLLVSNIAEHTRFSQNPCLGRESVVLCARFPWWILQTISSSKRQAIIRISQLLIG